jgi:hypothetical protein
VLPLETLKTFMALGVEAPKSNEDVPKTIETLEAKKKEFEEVGMAAAPAAAAAGWWCIDEVCVTDRLLV